MNPKTNNLFDLTYDCILEKDPLKKAASVKALFSQFENHPLDLTKSTDVLQIVVPGRPDKPELVEPSKVPRRGFDSAIARVRLVHAIAHIEFNAINLALDAVYRFQDMPEAYYRDWLQVAAEEAKHFLLLQDYLVENNACYGEYAAHNGLWEMALKTDHDVMVRMALVPRVLEARGLDVTPGMIQRLRTVGDAPLVSILELIHREEIGHVKIGTCWFNYACERQFLKPDEAFSNILDEYMQGVTFGPFDLESREKAGFSKQEMMDLMTRTYKKEKH